MWYYCKPVARDVFPVEIMCIIFSFLVTPIKYMAEFNQETYLIDKQLFRNIHLVLSVSKNWRGIFRIFVKQLASKLMPNAQKYRDALLIYGRIYRTYIGEPKLIINKLNDSLRCATNNEILPYNIKIINTLFVFIYCKTINHHIVELYYYLGKLYSITIYNNAVEGDISVYVIENKYNFRKVYNACIKNDQIMQIHKKSVNVDINSIKSKKQEILREVLDTYYF